MRSDPIDRWNRLGGTYGDVIDLPAARRRTKQKVGAKSLAYRQDAVFAMAEAGAPRQQIARELKMTLNSVDHYLGLYRLDRSFSKATDSSAPKFAHNDECVRQVMAHGGFPRLSERRAPGGQLIVCLPLVWRR